jgi:large subunit ribosomal protein L23
MAKSKQQDKAQKKSVLIKPRITEKSVLMQESRGVYAFNVEREATKKQIAASLKAEYKVTPEKIRLVAVPSKRKFFRSAWGTKGGGKKAYIYLKKGDKINVA